MPRYILKAALNLTTSNGPVKAGDDLAVIETDLQPVDLGSWLLYGHAKAVVSDEDAELLTVETLQQKRTEAENPKPEPEVDDSDLEDAGEGDEEADGDEGDSGDADDVPEHWAASLELDSRTVDALDDAGVDSIDDLRQRLNADEKIKGIGELREQEIIEAFDRIESESE